MLAVQATSLSPSDPLQGLTIGEHPDPQPRDGWVVVTPKVTSLNHHDLWSLRGVGLSADQLPRILGCDAAGLDPDGNEVVVHPIVTSTGWQGPEPLDPRRTLLSEGVDGTFAERLLVPASNLVPKPADLPWEVAAVAPVAWLTAYRMLFTQAGVRPGDLVLVQGSGGGVNSAAIQLASAAGIRVFATSRDAARRDRALALGAERVFEAGARLPEKVDAVIDNVGAATWSHSINVLRPGGTLVTCGATSGDAPTRAELTKVFFRELRVQGSTAGTREELTDLLRFMAHHRIEPVIDTVLPLSQARTGFARLLAGEAFGKIVFTH
ncbi:zinc-binding dehydrogenase [Brooklawnia cerclae]|uniref:NADPH:quinone reductase-like Zn-dependent oxidoreductase n=1 Tax=Brooklawnia cerclae TaxID=349934 RepID=A0ABX0SDM1_9ACTN|nr:zinc-binding dehydrogenase [Brooklawnia cerclae]NIH56495.1 NADPH:quinone reductase-like Zn-dependent oxidoreductase [Brooklawnia cerclae]